MDDLRQLIDKLEQRQFDYVVMRSSCDSMASALKSSGISRGWWYSLSEEEREELEAIALRLRKEKALRAMMILDDAVVEAAIVKVEALKSRKDNIKQAAATEILDRQIGKPVQRQELSGPEGGDINVKMVEVILPLEDDE